MNAAQHLERAEQLLTQLQAGDDMRYDNWTLGMAVEATAHAVIAVADILGVAHAPGQAGGTANG